MSDEQPELTDKQQLFVQHYVICLNATEAAARAGYQGTRATLAVIGFENLRKPKIRAAIDAAMAEIAMPRAEVLGRLSAQARADLGDFFVPRGSGMALDIKRAKELGLMPLAKKYTKTDKGVSIELYSAQEALALLGKAHRLFIERTEVTGANGQPIAFQASDLAAAREKLKQLDEGFEA